MGAYLERGEHVVSLSLQNARSSELVFYLEPWGEQYLMAPGTTFDVEVRGPQGYTLEVEYADEHITAYGWPGSTVSLFHEGTELGAGHWKRNPVPQTPHREDEERDPLRER